MLNRIRDVAIFVAAFIPLKTSLLAVRIRVGVVLYYPLVIHGIIYDTIPPKMSWGDRAVPWGRSRGFSEALSLFPGSPGSIVRA